MSLHAERPADTSPDDRATALRNVARCVLRHTAVKRLHNGRGRPSTYAADVDAIAGASRQLAEMVMAACGVTISTGIFLEVSHDKTPQEYECYCCGREVKSGCPTYLVDRETEEVLPPNLEGATDRGANWPIGPECRRMYPGIDQYEYHGGSEVAGVA